MKQAHNLIWLDLEMTGLDPEQDVIIEIATIVTDAHLNVLGEGPSLVIHQSDSVLENMNAWCIKQHGQSGLTQRVRESKVSCSDAEQQTLTFLKTFVEGGALTYVWQHHWPRSALFSEVHASVGGLFSLPQFRRKYSQRTGPPVAPRFTRRAQKRWDSFGLR